MRLGYAIAGVGIIIGDREDHGAVDPGSQTVQRTGVLTDVWVKGVIPFFLIRP